MNKIEVVSSMFKLFEIYPRVELLSRFLRFLVYWFEAINEPSGSTWYALNLFNGSRKKKKKKDKKDRVRVRRSLSSTNVPSPSPWNRFDCRDHKSASVCVS